MADTESTTRQCPYCKEEIRSDATAVLALPCRHRARLRFGVSAARRPCPTAPGSPMRSGGLNLDPRVFGEKPIKRDSSSQCPPLDSDDKGIWVYVAENETDCFYQLVVEWHPSPYTIFR